MSGFLALENMFLPGLASVRLPGVRLPSAFPAKDVFVLMHEN